MTRDECFDQFGEAVRVVLQQRASTPTTAAA